jgi:hypothetical protein
MPKQRLLRTVEDVLRAVQAYRGQTVIYRGVQSAEFQLLPKIGRFRRAGRTLTPKDERYILRLFKQRAVAHLDRLPSDEWEWLAMAQHHGLPTRLLDWTRNPLVATYFSVAEATADDSAVYAFRSTKYLQVDANPDPFKVDHVARVIPNHVTRRITAQAGLFTIHPKPYDPFDGKSIDKYVIPSASRKTIKKALSTLGIDRATLFPDLDGIANHVMWLRTDVY